MRKVTCDPDAEQCVLAPPSKPVMSSDGLFAASGGTSGLSPEQPSYLVPLSHPGPDKAKARRKKRSPLKGGGIRKKPRSSKKKRVKKPLKKLVGGSRVKKRGVAQNKRKCVKRGRPKKK